MSAQVFFFIIKFSKLALLSAGIVLARFLHHAKNKQHLGSGKKANQALTATAFLALAAFYNFGLLHFNDRYFHAHELFHYYMGSKYFSEVGHDYLYDAAIVADSETTHFLDPIKTIREQTTYRMVSKENVWRTHALWERKFTPERWEEFKHDLLFFEKEYPDINNWKEVLTDFGYNATPVWTMLVSPITNAIPTSNLAGIYMLIGLDSVLTALMFYCLYVAFGFHASMFSMLFWGTMYVPVFGFTGMALLRYDWIIYLMISICMLKMARPKIAGLFLALSVGMRIFPVLFAVPVLFAFFYRSWTRKTLDRTGMAFGASAIASGAALFLLTLLWSPGGFETWVAFYHKMLVHVDSWNTWNWGFKPIFMWRGDISNDIIPDWGERLRYLETVMPLLVIIQAAVMVLLASASARRSYWESMCLGGIVVFMFLQPTKYYLVYLVTVMPLLAFRLEEKWALHSLVFLFGFMMLARIVGYFNHLAPLTQFLMGLGIFLFYLYLLEKIWRKNREIKNMPPGLTKASTSVDNRQEYP